MPKKVILYFALIAAGLGACAPLTPAVPPAATPTSAPPAGAAAGAGSTVQAGSECTVVSSLPTPGPTEVSLFPVVTGADWVRGPLDAPVTFLEYSDFQCSFCSKFAPILEQIQAEFPQAVRFVFRHYPLNQHDKAPLGAQAAEAAGLQGKFWEMHDLIFAGQETWANPAAPYTLEQFETWLTGQAESLELDVDQFVSDLHSQALVDKIKEAKQYGDTIGLPGTPFLLVNGKIWQGPTDVENLRSLVRVILLKERQFTGCPSMTIDTRKQYIATLATEKGNIVIQLYADKAPFTVNSFVFLARNSWYDGVSFHRVVSNPDVAQAGDPSGTGWGGPGYTFKNELSPDLKFDRPGVVAMANSGPDTNGSQFFITRSPAPHLDGGYTIFGQVIQGMDVVAGLTPRDPAQGGELPPGDQILSVTIEEK